MSALHQAGERTLTSYDRLAHPARQAWHRACGFVEKADQRSAQAYYRRAPQELFRRAKQGTLTAAERGALTCRMGVPTLRAWSVWRMHRAIQR
jgi:hypothetical protein